MRNQGGPAAVLLMAYGAAASLDDIPAFLQDIRGGRPAGAELVATVTERYRLMGGRSPLLDITRAQAGALQAHLDLAGLRCKVYVGMRHSSPAIREAVEAIHRDGRRIVVAMPLTPYCSKLSGGAYLRKFEEAVGSVGADFSTLPVESWNDHPALIEAWASRVREGLGRLSPAELENAETLFTAHSLPARIVEEKDPYPAQLEETVKLVAGVVPLKSWSFAYQSRGQTSEPWLGPDAGEVLESLKKSGRTGVLMVPVGFISDHLETLYDIDVLYRGMARALGLRFERVPSLNADPLLIGAMADVTRRMLEQAGAAP